MTPNDRERVMRCLLGCAELYGKEIGEGAGALWLEALGNLPIETIERAFAKHLCNTSTGKFMPRPADILAQVADSDGRITADEAWTLIPRSEQQTTVWTQEIAGAYTVCADLIEFGDTIAARMAFKAAYEREVFQARQRGEPVVWFASLGQDVNGREAPILRAVQQGRLSATHAAGLLPTADIEPKILEHIQGKLTNGSGENHV